MKQSKNEYTSNYRLKELVENTIKTVEDVFNHVIDDVKMLPGNEVEDNLRAGLRTMLKIIEETMLYDLNSAEICNEIDIKKLN